MSKSKSRKPIEIKISTVLAVSAILHACDPVALDAAMREMTGGADDFFEDEFAIIDVASLDTAGQPVDWAAVVALLKSYRLNAVAVRNAPAEMEADILAHGLSIDHTARAREEAAPAPATQAPAPAPQAVAAPAAPQMGTMFIDTPVRAGQRIYARGADLVITAAVNNGAEVIADGSIHVYAPLRGRALAGATGNTESRIFALNMEAELVSIAGMYRTFEDGWPTELARQATQVRLVGDRIDLQAIKAA